MGSRSMRVVVCFASFAVAIGAESVRAQTTAVEPLVRIGMCDASAAAPLGTDRFLVANDEDNVLRIYPRGAGPEPVQAFDAAGFLQISGDHPESDIEGA